MMKKKLLNIFIFSIIALAVSLTFNVKLNASAAVTASNLWSTSGDVVMEDKADGTSFELKKSTQITFRNKIDMQTGFSLKFTLENTGFKSFNIDFNSDANFDPKDGTGSMLPVVNRLVFTKDGAGNVKVEYSFKNNYTGVFDDSLKSTKSFSIGSFEIKYNFATEKFNVNGEDYAADVNSSFKYGIANNMIIKADENNFEELVKFQVKELNGENFNYANDTLAQSKSTLIRPFDELNPKKVAKGIKIEYKFEALNVISTSSTTNIWYKEPGAVDKDQAADAGKPWESLFEGLTEGGAGVSGSKEEKLTNKGYTKMLSSKKVTFDKKGDYYIVFTAKGVNYTVTSVAEPFKVQCVDTDEKEPAWTWTKAKNDAYQEMIQKLAGASSAGESFKLPYPGENCLNDVDTPELLTYYTYYKTPTSTTFTKVEGLSFTPGSTGRYQIKLQARDLSGNLSEVSYKDGDAYGLFSLDFKDTKPPTISLPSDFKAYKDLKFTIPSASISDAVDSNPTKKTNLEKSDGENWVDITDKIENNQITFTELGKYRLVFNSRDSSGNVAEMKVKEFEVIEQEKPTLPGIIKDNIWTIVFTSIALLSAVGLVVLIFIKPKS